MELIMEKTAAVIGMGKSRSANRRTKMLERKPQIA